MVNFHIKLQYWFSTKGKTYFSYTGLPWLWNKLTCNFLIGTLFRASSYDLQLKGRDPKAKIPYNIYESGPTLGEYVNAQNRVHRWFKSIFLNAALWIPRTILGKYLVKSIPNRAHYRLLHTFDQAFDQSLYDWADVYMKGAGQGQAKQTKEEIEKEVNEGRPCRMLRTMKQIMLTGVKNDTAYMEFMNILVLNIIRMGNERLPKDYEHIFYSGRSIDNLAYFIILATKEKLYLEQIVRSQTSPVGDKPLKQSKPEFANKKQFFEVKMPGDNTNLHQQDMIKTEQVNAEAASKKYTGTTTTNLGATTKPTIKPTTTKEVKGTDHQEAVYKPTLQQKRKRKPQGRVKVPLIKKVVKKPVTRAKKKVKRKRVRKQ